MTIERFRQSVRMGMLLAFATLAGTTASAQNAVIVWDNIAADTIVNKGAVANAKGTAPGAITAGGSGLYFAFVHLAMYNAVVAIEGGYQPYKSNLTAPAGASAEAASIAAAHRILVNYFPDQQVQLDAQYSLSLATVPDGTAKDDGITVGEAAAEEIISARIGDGRGANVPYSFPLVPTAGIWTLTPGTTAPQTPWVGQLVPLTMTSAAQFLPDEGPPSLDSQEWADDYNQVKALGALNSTVRTAQQTEIGRFWTENTGRQYARAYRALAIQEGLDLLESARLFAMLWTAEADSFIGCMNAKYHFSFWRPVTAIRNGDIDGNDATAADPNWAPLSTTPGHPEYPAAHGCVTGAVADTLKAFFGSPRFHFVVSSTVTGTTHTFEDARDLEREVEWARIFAGFHYHHSLVQGFVLGHKVAQQIMREYFQPVRAQ